MSDNAFQAGDAAYLRFGASSHVDVIVERIDGAVATVRLGGLAKRREVALEDLDRPDEVIRNTREPRRFPWPAGTFVQGGKSGVVFGADGGSYRTAFVEAMCGTFLRGEGATVTEAEEACWAKYQRLIACDPHGPYEPRHYRNGSGFCVRCGTWFSGVCPDAIEENAGERTLLGRAILGEDDALREIAVAICENPLED